MGLAPVVLVEEKVLHIAHGGVEDHGEGAEEAEKEQGLKNADPEVGELGHEQDCNAGWIPAFWNTTTVA